MRRYITRACVAAAAGVALSTAGVSGASASRAAPWVRQAVRVPAAGRPLAAGGALAAASPGAQLWIRSYNGLGNNSDVAKAVAVSPDGKTVYVTGQSVGTSGGVYDYATVAYAAATGTRKWVARYNGPAGSLSNVPSAVAVSPDGKTVYVTGGSQVGQLRDYATVAYDAATGHQLWAKGYNGPLNNDDVATSVAVSPDSATVYVTGGSFGKGAGQDYATIAYAAANGTPRWVRRYNGPGNGNDQANAVTVNPATGAVYVTGQSPGGPSPSGLDYATIAYDASGTKQWVARYAGPGNNTDDATSVTVSPTTGTVYVTGYSWGGASEYDYATIAYTASGTRQWVARYNGPGNNYDVASSVAVSPASGTVYVTGKSTGTGTGYDYATIAYTASGTKSWVSRYDDPSHGSDIADALAVSPTGGTVYVTGENGTDYATIGYNAADGTQQWVSHYNGSSVWPSSIAVSPTTGTVFVGATSASTSATGNDYTTIAYQG
jgi:DNA-binding beta-propeller fold protein YncE